jgi:glycosyltransferase involved in cell wall biosynthesis
LKEDIQFSFVVPTYNRAHLITRTIETLLNQTYTNFEILVIDDGSTDNTENVVSFINDSRVKYHKIKNAERGAARNYGAKTAKGTWLNFFDSDDLAYTNHLEEAKKIIEKLHNLKLFCLGQEMKDLDGNLIFRTSQNTKSGSERILESNFINPNSLFVHKEVLNEIKFSEIYELSGSEDWVFHIQASVRFSLNDFSDIVTNCMIQHDMRSMVIATGESTLKRAILMKEVLSQDKLFMTKYKKNLDVIYGEMLSLSALHFALEKKLRLAYVYLLKSLRFNILSIFKRRTLAIIKHSLKL